MSINSARKLGFFAALTMLLGSIVGIGIFFKNHSILEATGQNGASVLTAWMLGGLLSLAAAFSFSEIGSKIKSKNIHGLPAWAEAFGGKKLGYFVRVNYYVIYFGILTPIISFFVAELFFYFLVICQIMDNVPSVWINGIFALALSATSIPLNFISTKASGWVQLITTILKFIPLLLAAIVGIIMATTHNAGGSNSFTNNTAFTLTGILAALPAVLFAYDAFLVVAALPEKTKGGTKTVSKILFIGLVAVIVLYLMISISAMFHGGTVGQIIKDSLPESAAHALNIFVYGFLFISGYGVLNGVSAGFVSYTEQIYKTKTVFGTKSKNNKNGIYILGLLIYLFGFTYAIVPAMIIGSDSYVDAVSNFVVLFFFGIYSIVILLFLIKSDNLAKYIKVAGWTFVVGVIFVVCYQVLYGFTIKLLITTGWTTSSSTGVGLFAPSTHTWTDLDFLITFISYLVIFFTLPIINYKMIKKFEKAEVIINTQK